MKAKVAWDNTRCEATGTISIRMVKVPHPRPNDFRTFIKEIDRQYPWTSHDIGGHRIVPSIAWMSDTEIAENAWHDPVYRIKFQPPHMSIRPPQFYAYNRYVQNIGQKLAEMNIEGVDAIFASVSFRVDACSYNTSA